MLANAPSVVDEVRGVPLQKQQHSPVADGRVVFLLCFHRPHTLRRLSILLWPIAILAARYELEVNGTHGKGRPCESGL